MHQGDDHQLGRVRGLPLARDRGRQDPRFLRWITSAEHLPEGMADDLPQRRDFENLSRRSCRCEGLCFALYDQPDLVEASPPRWGSAWSLSTSHLRDLRGVIAVCSRATTWAFARPRSSARRRHAPDHFCPGTSASQRWPMSGDCLIFALLRQPGGTIMRHLIDEVRIDAKHSYENAIIPPTSSRRAMGDGSGCWAAWMWISWASLRGRGARRGAPPDRGSATRGPLLHRLGELDPRLSPGGKLPGDDRRGATLRGGST